MILYLGSYFSFSQSEIARKSEGEKSDFSLDASLVWTKKKSSQWCCHAESHMILKVGGKKTDVDKLFFFLLYQQEWLFTFLSRIHVYSTNMTKINFVLLIHNSL